MNNEDRKMIKWLPFNSVISSKEMIKDILKEKNKIQKPNLSEEQKNLIEKNIIEAFYEQEKIHLNYFYSGKIYEIYDCIKKIDFTYHKIYFNNYTILFDQIINVLK